jgi:hypothetical protein
LGETRPPNVDSERLQPISTLYDNEREETSYKFRNSKRSGCTVGDGTDKLFVVFREDAALSSDVGPELPLSIGLVL